MIMSGLAALVAAPFVANATVTPAAMGPVMMETSADTGAGPMPFKRHAIALPIGLASVGLIVTGIVLGTKGSNANSPS